MQLARQAIQALPAVHGKDHRGRNRQAGFGAQFVKVFTDLPVLGEGWRPFQYRALGQAQQLIATGVGWRLRRLGNGKTCVKAHQLQVPGARFTKRVAPEMLQVTYPAFAAIHLGQPVEALVERAQARHQASARPTADDQQQRSLGQQHRAQGIAPALDRVARPDIGRRQHNEHTPGHIDTGQVIDQAQRGLWGGFIQRQLVRAMRRIECSQHISHGLCLGDQRCPRSVGQTLQHLAAEHGGVFCGVTGQPIQSVCMKLAAFGA
ncbi:hypothetical protein D3C81_881830 [compost metagenome]